MNYFLGIAIALDQLVNALIGGDPDEMISSRAHREGKTSQDWGIAEKVIDGLFFWQKQHCKDAYLYEKKQIEDRAKSYKIDL